MILICKIVHFNILRLYSLTMQKCTTLECKSVQSYLLLEVQMVSR